jgi:hypothetical protein
VTGPRGASSSSTDFRSKGDSTCARAGLVFAGGAGARSQASIVSPGSIPAFAAGDSEATCSTTTPRGDSAPLAVVTASHAVKAGANAVDDSVEARWKTLVGSSSYASM